MIHKIIGALFRKHGAKAAQVTPLFWKHGKTAAHHTASFVAKRVSIKGIKFPKV